MRFPHGSRSATSTHHPAASVTPNAGRFPVLPRTARASDDVLISHVGWVPLLRSASPDHVAHRPGPDGQPACPAYAAGWRRVGAYHARTHMASPCRLPQCFPGGWSA